MKIFAQRMREIMLEQNMTQRQLAEETGITTVAICRYVNGQRIPNVDRAARIAEALCMSLDWMCGLNEGGNA